MGIGALGIALGFALYGPELIRTVGSEITHLDKTRAFCVALATAISVIIAPQFGLPVSSTHIAVGGVFGVGFLRKDPDANQARTVAETCQQIKAQDQQTIEAFLETFRVAALADQRTMMKQLKKNGDRNLYLANRDCKNLRTACRKELVKRSLILKIAAA